MSSPTTAPSSRRSPGAPAGRFRFEAAVGGGIPVLSPLAADLAANTIHRVRGIVNGTTNFILTSMGEFGRSYDDVLAEAQALGYAEADPRGDVEGDDAVNKLVILARLAFGAWLDPARSSWHAALGPRLGPARHHRRHRPSEMEGAALLGLDLKLLALAEPGPGRRRSSPSVLPTAVPETAPLGGTDGVLNRVEILAEPVGDVAFSGPGAGGDATSSAVLGDLLAIARGGGQHLGRPRARADEIAGAARTSVDPSPRRGRGSPSCPASRPTGAVAARRDGRDRGDRRTASVVRTGR